MLCGLRGEGAEGDSIGIFWLIDWGMVECVGLVGCLPGLPAWRRIMPWHGLAWAGWIGRLGCPYA